jgi:hypothetical protein
MTVAVKLGCLSVFDQKSGICSDFNLEKQVSQNFKEFFKKKVQKTER